MSYYSYLWAKYSRQRLKEHPLCVYCRRRGKLTPARATDHIRPHKGDPELFWDPNNHQSLCFKCHASDKQIEEHGHEDRVKGGTILCVASGPSLTAEDVEFARSRVNASIAINSSYKMAPWAHIVYAADFTWWKANISAVRAAGLSAELWTVSLQSARAFKLRFIQPERKPGLSRDPSRVRTGMHSGYSSINLAFHLGARRILLLGYDMQRTDGKSHWHGDHLAPCHNGMDFQAALERMPRLAVDLRSEGVEVINCSRQTALTCFPRATIQEVLA